FGDHLGPRALQDECHEISVIVSGSLPKQYDYHAGLGGKRSIAMSCLVEEIHTYLQADQSHLVLVEDPCATPSDPEVDAGAAGPLWRYNNHVLWPIMQSMLDREVIHKALLWCSGGPEVIVFCRYPTRTVSNGHVITEDSLCEIVGSVSCLAT